MSFTTDSTSVTQKTLSRKLSERLKRFKQAQAAYQEDGLQTRPEPVQQHSEQGKHAPLVRKLQTTTAEKTVEVNLETHDSVSGPKGQCCIIQSSSKVPEEGEEVVLQTDSQDDGGGEFFENSIGKKFRLNLTEEARKYARDMLANARSDKPPTITNIKMLTTEALEILLKFNDRPPYNLTHHQLANMVLNYMKNGCPPRCPKCKKGALRFSNGRKRYGKRYYWCPGHTPDGRHFYGCGFRASREEITRVPWKCP